MKSKLRIRKRKGSCTYGADPEFIACDTITGKYISASSFVDSFPGAIGCDGARFQLELRPKFSTSPRGLVKNFRELLVAFAEKYPKYDIIWDGNRFPLGGHIHMNVFTTARRDRIIHELDYIYNSVMSKYNGSARGKYARAGEYRDKNWGFEYRSFSSYYWISPETARKMLEIIRGIVNGASCEDLRQKIEDLSVSLSKSWSKSLLHNWGIRKAKKELGYHIRRR